MEHGTAGVISFVAGLLIGMLIGGAIIYTILTIKAMAEAKTVIKTFSYDQMGRLTQVIKTTE